MFKLETPRLVLRKMTMDDFQSLKAIISDAETMSFYAKPFDDAGVKRWIDWNVHNYADFGFGLFAIVWKETGAFIGDCGITIQNIHGHYRPEIGYHVNKRYWRQGIAKEACQAIRDWAFNNTPFNTIYSYMNAENVASEKTALSNGMVLVDDYVDTDNEHLKVYAITRRQWLELKNRMEEAL